MRRRGIVLLGTLIFPALGGCGDTLGPPERDLTPPIQTDATVYSLREDWEGLATEIPFRYTNQTTRTLYTADYCGVLGTVLEKLVVGGWEEFWRPVVCLRASPPIIIEPGGVLVDTLHLWGALPGHNAGPEFKSDDVEGVYRIVMPDVVFHGGDPVPLEYRVSNHFVLDDPRR